MKLTISKGNMKLGNIPNLSLPPIKTCANGIQCAKKCYAMKAYRQYLNVRKAWDGNLALWYAFPWDFQTQLHIFLEKKRPRYFRYHVGGDIPSRDYGIMIWNTAGAFPKTQFLVYTKRPSQIDWDRPFPKNLHVLVSRWPGDQLTHCVSSKLHAQAWVLDPNNPDSRIPKRAFECPGSCQTCKFCYHAKPGQNVVFKIH